MGRKVILFSARSDKKPHCYLLYQEGIPLLDAARIIVSCFKCHAILGSVLSFLCNCLNVFDVLALDVLFRLSDRDRQDQNCTSTIH